MSDGPRVGILVGSESDRERMEGATALLDEAGVDYEFEVRSAHRTPDAVAEYAQERPRPRPSRPDLRRRPVGRAAGRRGGAHRPARDRRSAPLVA